MDIEEYKKSMPRCKDCTGFGCGECKTAGENEVACKDFERKPNFTNADRIRQMTDEELAKIMRSCSFCAYLDKGCQHNGTCTQGFLEWLKQEVKNDDER